MCQCIKSDPNLQTMRRILESLSNLKQVVSFCPPYSVPERCSKQSGFLMIPPKSLSRRGMPSTQYQSLIQRAGKGKGCQQSTQQKKSELTIWNCNGMTLKFRICTAGHTM